MEQLATDAQLRLVVREPWRDMRQRRAYLTGLPTLRKLVLVSKVAACDGPSSECNVRTKSSFIDRGPAERGVSMLNHSCRYPPTGCRSACTS